MRVQFTNLGSSVIVAMDYLAYDHDEWQLMETDGNLVVTFASGRTYEYLDVPFKDVVKVANGEWHKSVGATFNGLIKPSYQYREVLEVLA